MAVALMGGSCRCYRRCFGSSIQLLSGWYPGPVSYGPVYRMCRSRLELPLAKCYSSGSRKSFLSGLIENIKQELAKNKEMKDSIKKFRDEAKKLEESDALQEARRKYKSIESETVKTSEVIRKKIGTFTDTVKESLDEVSKSDLGRKIAEGIGTAAKSARQSAESVTRGGEKLGQTTAFRMISQGIESVKKELDKNILGQKGTYRRPERLRKRTELSGEKLNQDKVFQPNKEAMGVVLHKDSKWYQQWKDFKDNNVVLNITSEVKLGCVLAPMLFSVMFSTILLYAFNKDENGIKVSYYTDGFFEMKMKYDESNNIFIRIFRAATDKVVGTVGALFSKTEMSKVLTEILKVDPTFDKDKFLQQCEQDIIPNVLEAMTTGELDILKDWCYEAMYNQVALPIYEAQSVGLQLHSKVLDISNVDLAMGKMMEQGPVLIITFQAQMVMVVRNPKGELVEGDPDKVLRLLYVWALCRDQTELNPYAAWRLLDISASRTEQVI